METLPDKDIVFALESRGKVYRTDREYADAAKPGPDTDTDGSSGGCSDMLITIAAAAAIVDTCVKPVER